MPRSQLNSSVNNYRTREHDNYDFRSYLRHSGNIYYVDSGAASGGNGLSPEYAKQTLAAAVSLCTANNGDVVYVLEGHSEDIAAAGVNINTAGITIIGLGHGALRPALTWTATNSVLTISADNVRIENIITAAGIDEVVSMILVTGAHCTLDRIDFGLAGTGATYQAIQWLKTSAAADGLTIQNCRQRQLTAAASAQKWIELVGCDFTRIIDNTFQLVANASTSSHLISGSTAVVSCEIARNLCVFTGGTIDKVINLVTGSTGIISDNRIGSGTGVATAGAITGDGCFMFENYWADSPAASGLLAPAVDTDS